MHMDDIPPQGSGARPVRRRAAVFLALALPFLGLALFLPRARPGRAADPRQPGDAGVPAPAVTHTLYLPALFAPGLQPSSFDKIDLALQRGEIVTGTALVYQAYALFGGPLPPQYRGDDSQVIDTGFGLRVRALWGTLQPATQAALAPYLLPPSAPGSWDALQQQPGSPPALAPAAQSAAPAAQSAAPAAADWATIHNTGSQVKVWYHASIGGDFLKAKTVAGAVDADIWNTLANTMGPAPLGDANENPNGGDDLIDIYLVHMAGGYAETTSYHTWGGRSGAMPGYTLINANKSDRLLSTAAHEVMHLVQFAFNPVEPFAEYEWMMEATATWAEDFIYPGSQSEQVYAGSFLKDTMLPLESAPVRYHGYGAYLFPFFLKNSLGSAGPVKAMWANTEASGSLKAINAAIPGGFEAQWPEFVKDNWNRSPVNFYQSWDLLAEGAKPARKIVSLLGNAPGNDITLNGYVPHLSAVYYHISFPDPNIRAVAYYNPLAWETTAHVWGLVRMQGKPDWENPQDWTKSPAKFFCRDLAGERIAEMVVIISNSEWQDRTKTLHPASDPRVSMTNVGCWRWTGSVSMTAHQLAEPIINITETVSVSGLVFDNNNFQPRSDSITYNASAGTASWRHTGVVGMCRADKTGSYAVKDNGFIDIGPVYDARTRAQYQAFGGRPASVDSTIPYTCDDGSTQPVQMINPFWMVINGETVNNAGNLVGSKSWTDTSGKEFTMTWNLTPQRQP